MDSTASETPPETTHQPRACENSPNLAISPFRQYLVTIQRSGTLIKINQNPGTGLRKESERFRVLNGLCGEIFQDGGTTAHGFSRYSPVPLAQIWCRAEHQLRVRVTSTLYEINMSVEHHTLHSLPFTFLSVSTEKKRLSQKRSGSRANPNKAILICLIISGLKLTNPLLNIKTEGCDNDSSDTVTGATLAFSGHKEKISINDNAPNLPI